MTEIITGILIIILLILIGIQGQQIIKQQAQIDFLRETLTEFMNKTTEYVSAQNDANEAVIRTLEKDGEMLSLHKEVVMALAKHVEHLDKEVQKINNWYNVEE